MLPSGAIIGDYEILEPLARGAMGQVYVAMQRATQRRRALKTMQPELATKDEYRARFEAEAKAGARIESEHIVEVLDAGIDVATGMPWLAMELLEGETLGALLERSGALPPSEVLELFEQLAHGLSAAHRVGMVHRDLKPENVFVARSRHVRGHRTVKILDFGIAKWLADATSATGSQAIGTPLWMAPEQTVVDAPIDARTDVWPFGLMVFECITGKPYWRCAQPGVVPSVIKCLAEILNARIEPATRRAADLDATVPPVTFDDWFARCVARDPEERYASVDACMSELRLVLAPRRGNRREKVVMSNAVAAPERSRKRGRPAKRSVPPTVPMAPTDGYAGSSTTPEPHSAGGAEAFEKWPDPAPAKPVARFHRWFAKLARHEKLAVALAPALVIGVVGMMVSRLQDSRARSESERPAPLQSVPEVVTSISSVPAAAAVFGDPGLAIGPDGAVYVADTSNDRIRVLRDGRVETLAGGVRGFADGPVAEAKFDAPMGLAIAGDGTIYVADSGNQRIRVIRRGQVETIAGSGQPGSADGAAADAEFGWLTGVAVGSDGVVYVADKYNGVRAIRGGMVETIIPSQLGDEGFHPQGIAIGGDGRIYVADLLDRVIVIRDGRIESVEEGIRRESHGACCDGIAVGPDNAVYVTMKASHRVVRIRGGLTDLVAGSGVPTSFGLPSPGIDSFRWPRGIAVGPDGAVYVGDESGRIRVVRGDTARTIAGSSEPGYVDGPSNDARFAKPYGIGVAVDGTIYVADTQNNRIREIRDGWVRTIAGNGEDGFVDGDARRANFALPLDALPTPLGTVLVADQGNYRVREIFGQRVRTLAGSGGGEFADGLASRAELRPHSLALGPLDVVYALDGRNDRIRTIHGGRVGSVVPRSGSEDVEFWRLHSIAVDRDGSIFIAEGNRVRVIRDGRVDLVAGDEAGFANGPAVSAAFDGPTGVAVAGDGTVYVADAGNHRVRFIRDGLVDTLAGSGEAALLDGPVGTAAFGELRDIALGPGGDIYVVDMNRVRRIRAGRVETVAGR